MTRIGCRRPIRRNTGAPGSNRVPAVNIHRKLAGENVAGMGGYKCLLHLGSIPFL
jgi:hypothetical protein